MDFSEHVDLAKAKAKEIEAAAAELETARDLFIAAKAKLDALYSDMGTIETDAGADGFIISELREHRDADGSEAKSLKQDAAVASNSTRKPKRVSKKA